MHVSLMQRKYPRHHGISTPPWSKLLTLLVIRLAVAAVMATAAGHVRPLPQPLSASLRQGAADDQGFAAFWPLCARLRALGRSVFKQRLHSLRSSRCEEEVVEAHVPGHSCALYIPLVQYYPYNVSFG